MEKRMEERHALIQATNWAQSIGNGSMHYVRIRKQNVGHG
jgi:hypothetical protein